MKDFFTKRKRKKGGKVHLREKEFEKKEFVEKGLEERQSEIKCEMEKVPHIRGTG